MTEGVTNKDAHSGDEAEHYISVGYFDPLVGRRVIKRLFTEGVRFRAHDASRLDVGSSGIIDYVSWRDPYPITARVNRVEILVHSEDQKTTRKIIDEV
jgi:hypothetical protein